MIRRRALVGALALAVVLATLAGLWWWRGQNRSELDEALAMLPADTLRASWTDWQAARVTLDADVDSGSGGDAVRAFVDDAFTADLTGTSTLTESAVAVQQHFGFSPATADWELYGQSRDGAAMLLRLPEGTDFEALADNLAGLGYRAPAEETGVWRGGADLLPRIDPSLGPTLQHVALLADERLVLASDTEDYLEVALAAARGEGNTLDGAGRLASRVEPDPLAAVLFVGDFACEDLAMAEADDEDRRQGQHLVEDAGGVHPVTGLLVTLRPGSEIQVALAFEGEEQARHDAESRAALAAGAAPGMGGSFTDRFSVRSAASYDADVVLDLEGEPGAYAFSEITSGPVLFATC